MKLTMQRFAAGIVGFVVAGIAGIVVWLGFTLNISEIGVSLPVVVITGVFVLLATLAVVAFVFQIIGLGDPKQALGLPEGSIRAVIAISLVVLFTITSIYLYQSISSGGMLQSAPGLNEQQREDFIKKNPENTIVMMQQVQVGAEQRYNVYFQSRNSRGDDFAKQLLVMLGTLVTAVASFYFGANSVTSAVAGMAKADQGTDDSQGLRITAVTPEVLVRGGGQKQLKILGSNLAEVDHVRLSLGKESLTAANLQQSAKEITCDVDPSGASIGKWDVIVTNNKGVARLKNAVEFQ